jgi:circadian clock protein KaiC
MNSFLEACNHSRETAVQTALAFSRAVWRTHPAQPGSLREEDVFQRSLLEETTPLGAHALPALRLVLESPIHSDSYSGLVMARRLIPEIPAEDIQYFAMRHFRARGKIGYSAVAVRLIYGAANIVNWACRHNGRCELAELRRRLEKAARNDQIGPQDSATLPALFLELLAALGLMKPVADSSEVQIPETLSADRLLSYLFGVPSGIGGFDVLFGGGGMILIDTPDEGEQAYPTFPESVGGRTVLAVGPFGSGKSLLSLQFAVEIARKGGIAWVMAMEQPPEECLLSLEALGTSTHSPFFEVITRLTDERNVFGNRSSGRGAIVFLHPNILPYDQFLHAVRDKLDWLDRYPLRLLIMDPVNSLTRPPEKNAELRGKVTAFLQEAKQARVNIWLNCERPESGEQDSFEENISDTVLRLGVEWHEAHQKRYLQVIKSRLQREIQGKQAFFIRSGRGLRVYPSSATITPHRSRRRTAERASVSTGIPGLDGILGPQAVHAGDLIVFHGPTGTSKTLAGLLFLHGPNPQASPGPRSMIVMDSEQEKLERLVNMTGYPPGMQRRGDQMELVSILPGYIDPGHVLERIANRLLACEQEGRPVERLVLGNLSRWRMGMPLLRKDPVFGVALLNILRRHAPTTIVMLDDATQASDDTFESYMADVADIVLAFRRLQFRGEERHVVQVIKTPAMAHRKESFEITVDAGGMRLQPTVSLLRSSKSGGVEPVKIVLYLHSDTTNHNRYNRRLLAAVRASLSPNACVRKQDLTYDPTVFSMMASSAIDELQVFQLDEFQMPSARPGDGTPSRLVQFAKSQGEDLVKGCLPRFANNIRGADDQSFIAVPFYDNISLFAYQRSHFTRGKPFPENWHDLQKACADWERDHDGLFFGCHVMASNNFESYNCFFLEILRGIAPDLRQDSHTRSCDLLRWVSHPRAVEAGRIFQTLCRRSYQATLRSAKDSGEADANPYTGAVVWRHWYSTLNQMLTDIGSEKARDVAVRPLYQDMTTAGEWYLGIPVYSAAPETGLDVIRVLTAAQRELERLHLGVGMPTRVEFYESAGRRASISPYFEMSVEAIAPVVKDHAFQRSKFFCYQLFSETISSHLQALLILPDSEDHVVRTFESLKADIEFIRNRRECLNCPERTPSGSARLTQVQN